LQLTGFGKRLSASAFKALTTSQKYVRSAPYMTSNAEPDVLHPGTAIHNTFKNKKMLQIILAILLALSNPASNNTVPANNSVQVSTADYTGGETGHIPPRPPKP
jgi:hypothetical protein